MFITLHFELVQSIPFIFLQSSRSSNSSYMIFWWSCVLMMPHKFVLQANFITTLVLLLGMVVQRVIMIGLKICPWGSLLLTYLKCDASTIHSSQFHLPVTYPSHRSCINLKKQFFMWHHIKYFNEAWKKYLLNLIAAAVSKGAIFC